jgi:pimeloyl-ACP methyl ester carboxylesterase
MPKAFVNGLNIHYQSAGRGPDVVIAHGFTANSAFWYLTIVPSLRRDFRVITYDLRGHGKSDMPPCGYTSAEMAVDLRALIDHLGLVRIHLVGHSFGGEIALQYAVLDPERVQTLTLVDARVRALQPPPPTKQWPRLLLARRKIRELGITMPADRRKLTRSMLDELADSMLSEMLTQDTGKETFGPFGLGVWRRRAVEQWIRLFLTTTACQDVMSVAGLTPGRVSLVRQPVLAIYGSKSRFLGTLHALQGTLPNCKTVVVPDVGHFLPVVAQEVFLEHLRPFLANQKNGADAPKI